MIDERLMRRALELAAPRVGKTGDNPAVGCVLALGDAILGEAATAEGGSPHAEEQAIQAAGGGVEGATAYVTLEPCPMCAGAIVNARVARLVWGADDPKAGAVRSLYCICDDPRLNHRVELCPGVLAEPAAALLREFFRRARARAKPHPSGKLHPSGADA